MALTSLTTDLFKITGWAQFPKILFGHVDFRKNLHERDPKLYSIPKLKVNLVILAKRSPDHNRGILYIVQKLNEITF